MSIFRQLITAKVAELQRIEQNFRKSMNHNISAHTLEKHVTTAANLFDEIDGLLLKNQDEIPDAEFFRYLKQARNALGYVKQSIRVRIEKSKNSKMTTPSADHTCTFDIKLAVSVLLPFDGNSEKLSAFIEDVTFLKSLTTTATQTATSKLLLLTRVSRAFTK